MRHSVDIWIFSATITLALCLATPAEAANTAKHKHQVAGATAHATKPRRTTAAVQPALRYQGGVPAGSTKRACTFLAVSGNAYALGCAFVHSASSRATFVIEPMITSM